MKRIAKRISVLILCSTLVFASVDSIYHNTFTLEVQAAEVVITAEVGAAAIEYLWGLLLTMGLVSQVDLWSVRVSAIDTVIESIATYPELSGDTTFVISVGGEEVTVTLDQVATYIKHIVDGTAAVQSTEKLFEVLEGGGGNKDPNRWVRVQGGRLFSALVYRMITGVMDFVNNGGLSEEEIQQIESVSASLEFSAPSYAVENEYTCVFENTNNIPVFVNKYHFDYIQRYNLSYRTDTILGKENIMLGFREVGSDDVRTFTVYNTSGHYDYIRDIVCLVPQRIVSSSNGYVYRDIGIFILRVDTSSSTYCIYDYIIYRPGSGVNFLNELYTTEFSDIEMGTLQFPDWQFTSRGNGISGVQFSDYSACRYQNFEVGMQGIRDIEVYSKSDISDSRSAMPLLFCQTAYDMAEIGDMLCHQDMSDWDYGIFVNSLDDTRPVVEGSAYSKVSTDSLRDFADAMLNSDAPVSEKLDAADQIDKLRDVTPAELPELYPELYPEYAPGSADVPSTPPNPNRVVDSVATEIAPNPEPNPTPVPDSGDNELNGEDLSGVTFSLSEYFPFCIPFDLIRAFKLLVADAEAPRWEIPLHAEFLGYVLDYTFVIDMSQFEVLAKVFRTCETIGFCIGLVLITRNIIRG